MQVSISDNSVTFEDEDLIVKRVVTRRPTRWQILGVRLHGAFVA